MKIKKFVFNLFQENTYVLYDESKECVIIDPGCYTQEEEKELENFILDNDLKPVALLNTHCHIDHILGNQFVSEKWKIGLQAHPLDLFLLENAYQSSSMFGLSNYKHSPLPDKLLQENDTIKFGNSYLKVVFVPGHSPGHICFYSPEELFIISGDVLFQGSIGRTDLPGGDFHTLLNSITEKLFSLPEETKVYCGHGPSTVLAFEKEHNPFLQ